MIVTRTPTRISLGGGGTDIRSYASRFGGSLISAAIDKYVYITINKRFEDGIRVSYSDTEIVDAVDDIRHPIVRETLRLLRMGPGLEIVSIADVPANTGLGTSGSFTVGLLNALHTFRRDSVSPSLLAEEASTVLMDILEEPIGVHDQYLAAFGGVTCLEIDKDGTVKVSPGPLCEETVEELRNCILLFYTGIRRMASDVLADQSEAVTSGNGDVAEALHKVKEIGWKIHGALASGDFRTFGELMDEHWQFKKQLSPKVSSAQVDRWYELAQDNGAVGGKLIGAGGGGFLMFCCDNGGKSQLREAMAAEGLREMRFGIEQEGSKVLVNI